MEARATNGALVSHAPLAAGLSIALLFSACESHATPKLAARAPAHLSAGDAAAYERGRQREIELTRAALELVRRSSSAAQHSVL